MLDAGDFWRLGPATDRDHDVLGGVALAVDLDRVRVDHDATPVDDLDLRTVEHVDVDAVKAVEFLVLGGD